MKRVLLVTGAARGIGAAIAAQAAEAGYAVCVNYVQSSERAEEVRGRIVDKGGSAISVRADVSDENAVVAMFDECDRQLGKVTHLVNNAGIINPRGRVENCSAAALHNILGVNVVGAFVCAREAIRRMSTKHGGQGGSIVNISSVSARLGGAGRTVHYAASKSAINAFTWGLAQEVAAERIRVNAVAPGMIRTEMSATSALNDMIAQIPVGRLGEPDEVAAAVLWLLSDQASYVTGTLVTVSGAR